ARAAKIAAPAAGSGTRLRFALDAFTLEDGYLAFVRGDDRAAVENIRAEGSASFDSSGPRFAARLALNGAATAPAQAPLSLKLDAKGDGDALSGALTLDAAAARADGTFERRGTELTRVEIKELSLPPDSARLGAPSWPLQKLLVLQGTLNQTGNVVEAHLSGGAGKATASVEGGIDIVRWRSDSGLVVRARDVNLEELLENG